MSGKSHGVMSEVEVTKEVVRVEQRLDVWGDDEDDGKYKRGNGEQGGGGGLI